MKKIKRIITLVIAVALTLTLASCGGKKESVMEYKGKSISTGTYSYWLSTYKTTFLNSYNGGIDNDEFWDTKTGDGETYEEFIINWINKEIKYSLISLYLFDKYNLKLDDDTIDEIDADIEEKIEYAGSRSQLNTDLAKIGLNIDTLREVYIITAKSNAVYNYLWGEKGVEAPDIDDYAGYFKDNYRCIKCITIYTGAVVAVDKDGNYIYDDDGNLKIESLSDEEKAKKEARVAELKNKLANGADFSECVKEYSEVDYSDYPNGLFVSKNNVKNFGADLIKKLFGMEIGDVETITDENATYIIKRYELPEFTSLSETDINQLQGMDEYYKRELYVDKFDAYAKDITVNNDLIKSYDIREVSQNSYY